MKSNDQRSLLYVYLVRKFFSPLNVKLVFYDLKCYSVPVALVEQYIYLSEGHWFNPLLLQCVSRWQNTELQITPNGSSIGAG